MGQGGQDKLEKLFYLHIFPDMGKGLQIMLSAWQCNQMSPDKVCELWFSGSIRQATDLVFDPLMGITQTACIYILYLLTWK